MKASSASLGRVASLCFYGVAVLVVLAVGISVFLEMRIRSAAEEIDRLERNRSVRAVVAARPGRAASPAPAALEQASPPAVPRAWKWSTDSALVEQLSGQAARAMSPDLGLIRGASNRFRVRLRFNELYAMLGLSAAEIAAFEQAAAEKNLTFTPLISPDPDAAEAHRRSQANAMDRIVASALGPDYVEPFRAFLETSDLRAMTAEFAAHALGAGSPLDASQAAALLEASMEFRQTQEGAVWIDRAQVDWESVALRSQAFLTPAQQQLLRAMIDRRKFDQEFERITGLPLHYPTRGIPSR